jgi:hypothetical protein
MTYFANNNLLVTFVLMPCNVSEIFFDVMQIRKDDAGKEKLVMRILPGG